MGARWGRVEAWFVAIAVLLASLSFGAQLDGAFVWDDVYIVRDNPSLRDFGGLVDNFREDTWKAAGQAAGQFYRPLLAASFWVERQLGATSVWPHRVSNILLQLLCGLLLLRLLRRFDVRPSIAACVALLFVVHPVATEPVMWLCGRQEPLALSFTLASILVWPREDDRRVWLRIGAACLCSLCALWTKEGYGIAPLLLVCAHFAWHDGRLDRVKPLRMALPFAAVALGIVVRARLGIASGSAQWQRGLVENLRVLGTLFAYYGKLVFTLDNGLTFARFEPLPLTLALSLVLGLLALGLALLVTWWRSEARSKLGAGLWLGLLWYALALCPLVVVVPVLGTHQNRYAYFAMVGATIVLACAAELAARSATNAPEATRLTRLAWSLPVGLLLLATLHTRVEAQAWRDNTTLYGSDVQRDPTNGVAVYHLGHAVWTTEGCAKAVPFFLEAARLEPGYVRAWNNAAGCLVELGRYREALAPSERAVVLAPRAANAHYHLGVALLGVGERERGRREILRALELSPQHAKAKQVLAGLERF